MLGIKSATAFPFAPNPAGFLAVRNPTRRYIDRPGMMSILAYVLHQVVSRSEIDQGGNRLDMAHSATISRRESMNSQSR